MFKLDGLYRPQYMKPDCIVRRLRARVKNPHLWSSLPFDRTIRKAALLLVQDGYPDRSYRDYAFALCEGAVYMYGDKQWTAILKDRPSLPTSRVSPDDDDPLSTAHRFASLAIANHEAELEAMLKAGVDPNVSSTYFGWAIQIAARTGNMAIFSLLHQYNRTISDHENFSTWHRMIEAEDHAAVEACHFGNTMIARLIWSPENDWRPA